MKGLTNLIKFDNQGFRSDFVLDIIELSQNGIRKVGDWNSTNGQYWCWKIISSTNLIKWIYFLFEGVNFTRSYGEQQQDIVENLKNKTLVVTTILVRRFFTIKHSNQKLKISFYRAHPIACEKKQQKSYRATTNLKDMQLIWFTKFRKYCSSITPSA